MHEQRRDNPPTPRHKMNEETMGWLRGEPTLEDVLSDPIVLALMRRDHEDPDALRMFLENMKSAGRIGPAGTRR
jgi:hypothetical protein